MTLPLAPLPGVLDLIGEGAARLLDSARERDPHVPDSATSERHPQVESHSAHKSFGVSPDEITQTVDVWRSQSDAVAAIDLAALSSVPGAMSDVATSLHTASTSAWPTLTSIAVRLATLADSLAIFNASAIDRDRRAATALLSTPSR